MHGPPTSDGCPGDEDTTFQNADSVSVPTP
jgi:hypothetical protein